MSVIGQICRRHTILENSYATDKKIRGKFELDEVYFGDKRERNHGRGVENKS